jgi:hypothetical protein
MRLAACLLASFPGHSCPCGRRQVESHSLVVFSLLVGVNGWVGFQVIQVVVLLLYKRGVGLVLIP